MANPFDQFDGARPVTVPLGPRDPYKSAAEARAQAAERRAQAAEARAEKKFQSEDTMAPPPGDASKTGDEYLATIPPALAGQVKALADGRRAFPTGSALRSPAVQQLIAAATQYDPTLDAANAATRVATRKKFTSGTTRDNITAINTALGHLGTLWKDGQALNNFGSPILNAPVNYAEQKVLGDPRVTNFNLSRHAVVDELEKAFRGSSGSQAGIEEWKQSINSSQSPEQLRGAIGKGVQLLSSRLDALNDAYTQGMGHSADPMTFLNPHAQQVFSALGPGGDGNVPDPPKNGPTAPPILGGDTPPPGPGLTPATGDTKTEITRGPLDAKISAMLSSGAPSANIRAFAKSNGYTKNLEGVLAFRAMHPNYRGGYDVHEEKIVPTTAFNKFAGSPVGAGLVNAGDAMTMGFGDEMVGAAKTLKNGGSLADNIASTNFDKQMLSEANPGAALAGQIGGGATAMIGGGLGLRALLEGGTKGGLGRNVLAWAARNPIKAAAAGDAAYGGAYGAGENNDNRALGAAIGAPVGMAGSFLGSGVARGAGATLEGVVNPAVKRLRALGIPLTAGEVLGGGWKKAQDALTSVLGPGGMVSRRYADGRRALNEVGYNTAGQVVDTPINAVGQQGIDLLDTAKSRAYSRALDPIQLNLNDPQFLQSMEGAIKTADAIPGAELPEGYGGVSIRHYVGNHVDPGGTMAGPGFQKAYRGLAQTANKAAPKIEGYDIGQAVGQAKDALSTALQTQNPEAYQGFLRANQANRMLNILADAHNAAKNQITDGGEILWTPAQLGTAATANAKKYGGNIAAASGNRPFNQLINDSQQVMSSKVPDSGTPRRQLAMALATGGAVAAPGGLGYATGGETGAELGLGIPAALTILGTRKGQQLLAAALTKRTVADQIAGRSLRRNPGIGGDLLASLGIPLLDSPSP